MVAVVNDDIKSFRHCPYFDGFFYGDERWWVFQRTGKVCDHELPDMLLGREYDPFLTDGVEHGHFIRGGAKF